MREPGRGDSVEAVRRAGAARVRRNAPARMVARSKLWRMDERATSGWRIPPERGATLERVADELTRAVCDELGPTVARYRARMARSVGLGAAELTCVERLHRAGPQPSADVGDRTGLTRSSVSKMLTRLERAGHVERAPAPDYAQVVVTRLAAHEARDRELAAWRDRVRVAMLSAAHDLRLDRDEHRVAVIGLLRAIVDGLESAATDDIHREWCEEAVRREAVRRR